MQIEEGRTRGKKERRWSKGTEKKGGGEEGQSMVRGEERKRKDRVIKAGREGRGREEVLRGKRKNSARI